MKLSAILPCLLAALLAARAAAAQNPPPRDPLDDTTIRFGPVGLTPVLALNNVGRDNNVFNEATNPKSDFTFTLSPKLDVLLHTGPLLLSLSTTTDYIYFQTYTTERATNVASTARADFTFGPVRPYITAGGGNVKDRINREIDQRARHEDRAYGAGVNVQVFEGLFTSVGVRQATTTFDENQSFRGEDLASALNEKMEAVDATVGVNVTPLTSISVVVTKQRDRFDQTPDRDSDTLRIMPTVRFSPLAILQGTASLGYRRFDIVNPGVPDYSGFVATLTLGTTIRDKQHLEATFGRDVQYSYEEDVVYYLETGIQGSWTWQISSPIDVRLTGGRSRLHYPAPSLTAATDDDVAMTYGGGAGWRLREHLKIGVNADFRQRDSERSADRGFNDRKIYAYVTWGKQ